MSPDWLVAEAPELRLLAPVPTILEQLLGCMLNMHDLRLKGSVVKGMHCSSREPKFSSQHPGWVAHNHL